MKSTQRARGILQAIAVALSLALPLIAAASPADARIGGGVSSGSRGARTFSAPPSTSTAPNAAQPFNRTMTQPGSPGLGTPAGGGFFNRPGMGMLGGLAAGFLGAGLLGMLFGGGMFGGLGGLSSIIGLMLQIGLIIFVVRLAMSWWQRRHETAAAFAGGPAGPSASPSFRTATGFGLGSGSAPLEIIPSDYEAFERLLGEIQDAWSNEDVARLHTHGDAGNGVVFHARPRREQGPQRRQQGFWHQAAAGRPRGSLARGRRPTMRASRCDTRWSTRPSIAPPAGWSKAATRRWK